MAKKPTRKDQEALDRAQDIAFDAWDATAPSKRRALAEKALAISPLCADAWGILAQLSEAGSDDELEYWRRAVEAGKSALGDSFEEMVGEFWGWMETRPYMRARQGLARALWQRGLRDEATDHLKDMLRLNPNDNQGVRYALIAHLAETDDHKAITDLRDAYPEEDMAMWAWPLALAAFRRSGDAAESRKALDDAMASNAHVPAYLLGRKKLPKRQPVYYGYGDQNEAVLYVVEFGDAWSVAARALQWLERHVPAKTRSGRGVRVKLEGIAGDQPAGDE
ncbi:tetratricopeptide repeat protein [Aminobacter sp. HY435]|uniref:tetratricopeptide repeat protein n=1 Tax=Aminobacter sp. HY435 TaxID=2970917 RepID=UPI0022B94C4D|nr:hypothetical protein [Aminobacter sp. HY435]